MAKQIISTDWEPKNSAEKPVQLASTFSLFFSAAPKFFFYFSYQLLNFCLGFSAVPKTWKNSNVLNTLLECDISRALFFKILTTLPNLHMYYLPKVMKSQNMKRTKHTTLILTFIVTNGNEGMVWLSLIHSQLSLLIK